MTVISIMSPELAMFIGLAATLVYGLGMTYYSFWIDDKKAEKQKNYIVTKSLVSSKASFIKLWSKVPTNLHFQALAIRTYDWMTSAVK